MKHIWKQESKCSACKGTGIYVGLAERDGIGVVCYKCKGTGRVVLEIEWEDFKKREKREDVVKVLEINPGIVATTKIGFDFGGMSYGDWFSGKPFPAKGEMRKYVCPCLWYQNADYERKPKWDECAMSCMFSQCKRFKEKEKCWERFDKEGL